LGNLGNLALALKSYLPLPRPTVSCLYEGAGHQINPAMQAFRVEEALVHPKSNSSKIVFGDIRKISLGILDFLA
jgi:hypothetical protein